MSLILRFTLFLALCMFVQPYAYCQTAAPQYLAGSTVKTADAMFIIDKSGNPFGTPTNPLNFTIIGGVPISGTVNVACISGCSGGGGSGGSVTQSGSWNVGLTGALPSGTNTLGFVNLGSTDSGNLAAVVTALAASNTALATQITTLNSQLTQLTSAVSYLGTLASYANSPIAVQTGHGSLIGAVEGATAAGTAATYPLSVQLSALVSGVTLPISQTLSTSNGWTSAPFVGLSTTVKQVKASAGQVGEIECYNANSYEVDVQIFNAVPTSVTLGTTVAQTFAPLPPLSLGGLPLANPGINFSTAISVAATTTPNGATAPAAAPNCIVIYN